MIRHLIFISLFLLSVNNSHAQEVRAYKAEDLIKRAMNEDTLYVINFWATWCAPCIKELPEFDILYKNYEGKPVKILLISLDFKEDYKTKLPRFLKKKKLLPEIGWLNESLPNDFIPKIAAEWQGSIPATLILSAKNEYRYFIEGTIIAPQLQVLIDKQLALQ